MKQAEIIKQMTDDELKKQVVYSQILFFFISMILSFFLFDRMSDWFTYFILDSNQIMYFGVIIGIIVVIVELALFFILPKRWFDDGGINEKLFRNQSVFSIFMIALIVAISEEFLFRGVIQTSFGYIFASSLFAFVHIRYLKKPLLLALIILISFLFGYIFEVTQNLLVTIVLHFVVDFLLGLFIMYTYQKRGV